MSIWFKEYKVEDLVWMGKNNLIETLGMEIIEFGKNYIKGRMPIDHRTVQPFRILHGGASVALAETLGSMGSYMIIDPEKQISVGQMIHANHIRPGTKGYVNARAEIMHKGRTSHIWNIDLTDDDGKMLCSCRLTMAILPKP